MGGLGVGPERAELGLDGGTEFCGGHGEALAVRECIDGGHGVGEGLDGLGFPAGAREDVAAAFEPAFLAGRVLGEGIESCEGGVDAAGLLLEVEGHEEEAGDRAHAGDSLVEVGEDGVGVGRGGFELGAGLVEVKLWDGLDAGDGKDGVEVGDGLGMALEAAKDLGADGEGERLGWLGLDDGVEELEGLVEPALVAGEEGEANAGGVEVWLDFEGGGEVAACGFEVSMGAIDLGTLEQQPGFLGVLGDFEGKGDDHFEVVAMGEGTAGGEEGREDECREVDGERFHVGLDMDAALEDERGGAIETDVLEGLARAVECHLELVSALDLDPHGAGEPVDGGGDEGGGGDAGATGEGLALDAAFIGSDADAAMAEELGEVDVGAAGLEVGMMAQRGSLLLDHGFVGVWDEDDGVGYAGVDGMDDHGLAVHGDGLMEAEVGGVREADGDPIAGEGGVNDAGEGFEGDLLARPTGDALDEAGKATGAVPAHFRVGAVRVIEAPCPVCPSRGAGDEEHEAVGSDAELPVAEAGDGGPVESHAVVAVVEQDEVIARAAHLEEVERHWVAG